MNIISNLKKVIQFIVLTSILSSCASIWISKNQKVSLKTNNENSVVVNEKLKYVIENSRYKAIVYHDTLAKGKNINFETKKVGFLQLIVKTPGYKDEYYVLPPSNLNKAFYPLYYLSWGCGIIPGFVESTFLPNNNFTKKYSYEQNGEYSSKLKLITRGDKKYITIDAVNVDIKDFKNNYINYDVPYFNNIDVTKCNESSFKRKDVDTKDIKFDNSRFTYNLYTNLTNSGFIDTVNTVFHDDFNTINVEGSVKKIIHYNVNQNNRGSYFKTKIAIVWKVKNRYGEILDSIEREEFSGDFAYVFGINNILDKSLGDAIDISFNKLLSTPEFAKYLEVQVYKNPTATILKIKEPNEIVQEVSDASLASVIIKRKDRGHGSGFAISKDGYILTNFHVIAEKYVGKYSEITVILNNGDEYPATVVRVNKDKDIALLKIEKEFEKVFKLEKTKKFTKLQDIYCIGTPKSIQLGQSVSAGILSNERNLNNNVLLQLGISINSGNSGGPLFDKNGNLHGVIESKLVGFATEGIGFAIPSYLIPGYLNIEYIK
ncbi:MAG: hypothetical protein RLZZ175_2058 [Bacteroidota bacterium]|jgi:S1-C subfamily serine protease